MRDKSRDIFFNYFSRGTHLCGLYTAWYFCLKIEFCYYAKGSQVVSSFCMFDIYQYHSMVAYEQQFPSYSANSASKNKIKFRKRVKEKISCPKISFKTSPWRQSAWGLRGGWVQQKCLNRLPRGVSAKGPQGKKRLPRPDRQWVSLCVFGIQIHVWDLSHTGQGICMSGHEKTWQRNSKTS